MTLLDDLERLVRDHYVVESDVDAIGASLRRTALPDHLTDDLPALAAELTARLRAVNGDAHLGVTHLPGGHPVDPEGEARTHARRTAGGIAEVRRLDDGVGLLAVSPYTARVDLAAPYVEAAFALLAGVEHLVIDLRQGYGGTPETVALLCSHLVAEAEPVHLQDVVGRRSTRQFWTTPTTRALGPDVRITVLTSARTFSGCEELAYDLQALGRARIVGETTAGGAHPVEHFTLSEVLVARVPVGRSVNAATDASWERVGVQPDVPCAEADALARALDG